MERVLGGGAPGALDLLPAVPGAALSPGAASVFYRLSVPFLLLPRNGLVSPVVPLFWFDCLV